MSEIRILPLGAAVARPGDTLFIGFSEPLDEETIEALEENFRPYIEAGIQVGYIDNVSSMVVMRPNVTFPDHAPGKAVLCIVCFEDGKAVCTDGADPEH